MPLLIKVSLLQVFQVSTISKHEHINGTTGYLLVSWMLSTLQCTGQLLTTKNCPAQNVNSAKAGSKVSVKELDQMSE